MARKPFYANSVASAILSIQVITFADASLELKSKCAVDSIAKRVCVDIVALHFVVGLPAQLAVALLLRFHRQQSFPLNAGIIGSVRKLTFVFVVSSAIITFFPSIFAIVTVCSMVMTLTSKSIDSQRKPTISTRRKP